MPDEHGERYVGVQADTRPPDAKLKDYAAAEAYTATEPVWRTKREPSGDQYDLRAKTWRRFPARDQGRQSSCVGNASAKALGVEEYNESGQFVVLSHEPIYHSRPNRPSPGMSSVDAFDFGSKKGTTTEARLPSQKPKTEEDMNDGYVYAPEDFAIAERHRGGGYVAVPLSIDAVAAAIETKRVAVPIHIFATYKEWNKDYPQIIDPALTWEQATVRHCVTAVDYTLVKGKKHLVIEDSWGQFEGLKGQRLVSEDFLKLRLRYAGHYLPRPNGTVTPPVPAKPALPRDLGWGMTGDDVKAWQAYLKGRGFFPENVQATGSWYAITAQATLKWQVSKGITDFVGKPVNAVRFGPRSRRALADER